MKRIKIMAVLLLSLLLSATGAAEGPINRRIESNTANTLNYMPEAARERTDTLVIGVPDLLGETNPFWVRTTGDHYAASLLYDELIFFNSLGEIGAGVAKYSRSSDGCTYTFTIQDGVYYADGEPVLSDDFINALYLLLMPGYDGTYDITRAGIVGVEEYLDGREEVHSIAGIARVDDRTFSVTLESASEENAKYLAIPALRVSLFGSMQRPEEMTDPEDFAVFCDTMLAGVRRVEAAEMAYGQYLLEGMQAGEIAVLTKNETYWRGAPNIGTVELKVIPVGAELDAIMEGMVDIISLKGEVKTVDRAYDYETGFINLYTWEGDALGYLGMDLENALFSDKSVRQALVIGLDREQIRKNSVERYGNLPDMLLFDSFQIDSQMQAILKEQFQYNPERAAIMLEDAGWILGEEGVRHRGNVRFSFTIHYNTPHPYMDAIIPVIEENYRALGIEVKFAAVSFEELLGLVDQNACEMYFRAVELPQSPALAVDLFMGNSHLNQSGHKSGALDRLLTWAALEDDAERQMVIYEEIYQVLLDEMPFIPLYRRAELLLINARVMNATVTTAQYDITSDVFRFFLRDTLEGQW